jgi:hypothetical protein
VVGFGEAGDPASCGGEGDPVPGLAGADAQTYGQVGLAGARDHPHNAVDSGFYVVLAVCKLQHNLLNNSASLVSCL